MSAFLELFAFGTLWFWIPVVVLCAAILWHIEHENVIATTFFFVATLACLQFIGKVPVFDLVVAHPFLTVGIYVVIGVGHGFARWALFCSKFRGRYTEVKVEFAKVYGLPKDFRSWELGAITTPGHVNLAPGHVNLAQSWYRMLEAEKVHKFPIVRENKSRIMTYMAYWPWSFVWWVIRDLVRDVWEHIYQFFAGLFQRIADRIVGKDIQKDFQR